MLKQGLLTPYRGIGYHLKDYSTRGPRKLRELFDLQHSSLWNVIERTFGELKKRFPINDSGIEPHYSFEVMIYIIFTWCILHNNKIDRSQTQQRDEDYRLGSLLRDTITAEMWNPYEV